MFLNLVSLLLQLYYRYKTCLILIVILVFMSVLYTFCVVPQLVLNNKFTIEDVSPPDHKKFVYSGSLHYLSWI